MRKISFVLALLLALLFAACGEQSSNGAADEAGFQAQLEEIMKEQKFSGVVRVSLNGEVLCEAANGKLGSDSAELIKTDSQFAIASVSKQFTAACVMLLSENGKLSVDDTIDRWFPEYKYGSSITVKNLLTMRSGIRDYVNDADSDEEYFERYDLSENASAEENRSKTREWIFSKELGFKPGEAFEYSNSNYFLLAEIVEKASGQSFSDYLKEKFLVPLGMSDTGTADELSGSARLVPPETDNGISEIKIKGLCFGDGELISTAADMDKWMSSLSEHKILSQESVREMTTDFAPESKHYGYGLFVSSEGVWYHDGEVDSYFTHAFTDSNSKYNLFASTASSDYSKLKMVTAKIKEMTRPK